MEMDIPLAKPVLSDETVSEAAEVLQNEFYLRGESVETFEEEFADYVGTDYAIAVSSGTQAIHLSLRALGISEGDTVLTTPATFISTGNAILRTGAEPKFVDVDLDTYTIDLSEVERAVSEYEIDAILPIHLYGYPVAMDTLREIAGDIPIVSDSCQAHGAKYKNETVGSFADAGAFSFYPSKNITVGGDGGMITTDSEDTADAVRTLRDVGRSQETGKHTTIGYTARMGTVNAAIGRKQLDKLDSWNRRRTEIAMIYSENLTDHVTLPPTGGEDRDPAWYMYVIQTTEREELSEHLDEHGVETGIHYETPVHLQQPYQERGHQPGEFPDAERWSNEVLSLPVHPHITNEEAEHIVSTVNDFFQ